MHIEVTCAWIHNITYVYIYISYHIFYNIIYTMYCCRGRACSTKTTDHTAHIHPEGTARESLFIHTAGGIAIQDYVHGVVLNNSTIKIGAHHRGPRARTASQPQK